MGDLNELVAQALKAGLPHFGEFLDEVQQLIESEDDLVKARNLIFGLLASASVSALAVVAYETSLHAEMYARLQDATDGDARSTLTAPAALASSQTFANKPFAEAVAEFKRAVPMGAAEWKALEDEHRARGFTMAATGNIAVIRDAHAAILDGLERGVPARDVVAKLRASYTSNGEENPGRAYLQLVYDNAVLKSYGQGRWHQMTAPDVLRQRPYWQYRTRRDGRVRPAHQALDRKVFAAGSVFWQRWYPPNGHGCRCGVDTLSPAQVEAQGLQVESELPRQIEVPGYGVVQMIPEPGWGGSPATAHAAEAAAGKVTRAVERTPLLQRDPAGLVRDDARRGAVVRAAARASSAELKAQLAELPRFSIYPEPPSAPPAGAAHVDWHMYSQNGDSVAQLVTRAVQEPELYRLREAVSVVPRVSFDAALDTAARPDPELVWLDELAGAVSPAGRTVGASTEVAVRFAAQPDEIAPLLAFLDANGERRPGATPVKWAWTTMEAELALGEGVDPPDLGTWRQAHRLFRRAPGGQLVSTLARTRLPGWDRSVSVWVNRALWDRLG